MKILVLSKNMDFGVTGGQMVNKRIYDLLSSNGYSVTYCQQLHPAQTNWKYLISLFLHFFEYIKYDKIIIDSSSFPKTCLFVTLANFLGKRNRLITTLHHYTHCNMTGIKGKIYKLLELLFVRQCSTIIIFSPFVLDLSKQWIHNSKLIYVGLPFIKKVHSVENRQEGELLYVGTIEKRKGVSYLIDALIQLNVEQKNDTHLNIVGKVVDQNYYNELKTKIEEAGIEEQVTFKGRVSDEELDRLYSQARLFTFPSLYEGFGMVLIEAMGYGLPVVCFNNSAMPYTVRHEKNGIVVQNENSKEFGMAIERLMEDKNLYAQLSIGAYETYKTANSFEEFDAAVIGVFNKA